VFFAGKELVRHMAGVRDSDVSEKNSCISGKPCVKFLDAPDAPLLVLCHDHPLILIVLVPKWNACGIIHSLRVEINQLEDAIFIFLKILDTNRIKPLFQRKNK